MTEVTTPLVEVRGLSKRFGVIEALADVTFDLGAGEVVGLIGPNGAGKTTLLECLSGLQLRDAGRVVTLAAAPRAGHGAMIFYVPDGITPWETRPLSWVLRFVAALHDTDRAAVGVLIDRLGLATLARQPVGQLSRGQRKRMLIAMGLLTCTPLLLLDEPFDGLDLRQVRDVANLLRSHAAGGRTLFLSIHQLADAARVCDRMVLLSAGRVVGTGTLDELRQTAHLPGANLEELFLALT